MILVVEPNDNTRREIVAVVKWIDSRYRVEATESWYVGLRLARRQVPQIVIQGPGDRTSVEELRAHLPNTKFVGFSGEHLDCVLTWPIDHRRLAAIVLETRPDKKGAADRAARRKASEPIPEISVLVSAAEQSALSFKVNVPGDATIESLLRQLGKSTVVAYTIYRDGQELSPNLATPLMNGDRIMLKAEAIVPAGRG